MINAEVWEHTRNPWTLLQDASRERVETLARDRAFREELRKLIGLRERYRSEPSWYAMLSLLPMFRLADRSPRCACITTSRARSRVVGAGAGPGTGSFVLRLTGRPRRYGR